MAERLTAADIQAAKDARKGADREVATYPQGHYAGGDLYVDPDTGELMVMPISCEVLGRKVVKDSPTPFSSMDRVVDIGVIAAYFIWIDRDAQFGVLPAGLE